MSNYIYDRFGNAVLRVVGKGRIVDLGGRSIGFLDGTSVYDYNGRHRGWLEQGLLRDQVGAVSGFMKGASGPSPLRPLTKLAPLPRLVQLEPLRPLKGLRPVKPINKIAWSAQDPLSIFEL